MKEVVCITALDTYSVYCHTNICNGKKYIGITKRKPEDRWGNDGVHYKNKCPHLWNAIQKYGWNCFNHEILYTGLTKTEACNEEIGLIKKYKSNDPRYGYNILAGGSAPSIPLATREKMSRAMKGNKNGKGKKCSDEKKKKISDAQKGRKFSEDHKQKISIAKKGKSHPSPSIETRRKISESHFKKPVFCVETNTVYESIQACSHALKIDATSICAVCKGKHSYANGLHFKYYDSK